MAPAKNTEVYVDGASRGNPGESGIGVLVIRGNGSRREIRKYLGKGTNNEAEYKALIEALGYLSDEKSRETRIHTDSLLVANQMNGLWKVKDPEAAGPPRRSEEARFPLYRDKDRAHSQRTQRGSRQACKRGDRHIF